MPNQTHTHTPEAERNFGHYNRESPHQAAPQEKGKEKNTHTHTHAHTQAKKKTSNDYEHNAIGIRTSKQIQVQCDTT